MKNEKWVMGSKTGVRVCGISTNNRGPRYSALIPLYFLKNKGLYGSEMGSENEQP
jgi:hypothetical protein